jgi:hypothetical protein
MAVLINKSLIFYQALFQNSDVWSPAFYIICLMQQLIGCEGEKEML